jgi:hypothetical protein
MFCCVRKRLFRSVRFCFAFCSPLQRARRAAIAHKAGCVFDIGRILDDFPYLTSADFPFCNVRRFPLCLVSFSLLFITVTIVLGVEQEERPSSDRHRNERAFDSK